MRYVIPTIIISGLLLGEASNKEADLKEMKIEYSYRDLFNLKHDKNILYKNMYVRDSYVMTGMTPERKASLISLAKEDSINSEYSTGKKISYLLKSFELHKKSLAAGFKSGNYLDLSNLSRLYFKKATNDITPEELETMEDLTWELDIKK